ncbi:hypothetical protein I315_06090 [Cryptococcus gattii Ru294]|nr:hypothetical protein I315_06090 [Cryptococcus gattii Ru294]
MSPKTNSSSTSAPADSRATRARRREQEKLRKEEEANGYFTCSQHEDNVPNNYDPTVSTIVKCGLMLRPGLDDLTLDEWSIPGHRDRTLSSARICDVDIPIRKGVHWPYTNEGVPFVLSLTPLSIAEASSRTRAGRLELVMDLQHIAILLTQPKNAKVQKGHHAAVTLLSGFLRL